MLKLEIKIKLKKNGCNFRDHNSCIAIEIKYIYIYIIYNGTSKDKFIKTDLYKWERTFVFNE